jgi:hypothetical protein
MVLKYSINLGLLSAAHLSLKTACSAPPSSDLERDGTIHRFEKTFDLAWKTIRKALIAAGRADLEGSPRPILRAAREDGLIEKLIENLTHQKDCVDETVR